MFSEIIQSAFDVISNVVTPFGADTFLIEGVTLSSGEHWSKY
jgi:hypothetical protein